MTRYDVKMWRLIHVKLQESNSLHQITHVCAHKQTPLLLVLGIAGINTCMIFFSGIKANCLVYLTGLSFSLYITWYWCLILQNYCSDCASTSCGRWALIVQRLTGGNSQVLMRPLLFVYVSLCCFLHMFWVLLLCPVVFWGCVMLNWHRHRFCSVPQWPSMMGRVVMFIKCSCPKGMNKVEILRHWWVSRMGSPLKLCLMRLFSPASSPH